MIMTSIIATKIPMLRKSLLTNGWTIAAELAVDVLESPEAPVVLADALTDLVAELRVGAIPTVSDCAVRVACTVADD